MPEVILIVSLTECKRGKTQKLSFGVNITIELKNMITSDSTRTLVRWNAAR